MHRVAGYLGHFQGSDPSQVHLLTLSTTEIISDSVKETFCFHNILNLANYVFNDECSISYGATDPLKLNLKSTANCCQLRFQAEADYLFKKC
ncbi:hypothetical protein FKM82_001670 [Ascaphus truei]